MDSLITSFEGDHTNAGQRSILAKIQKGLITTQDIGDDKLATVQDIVDTIENKSQHLEHDAKNLDFNDSDPVPSTNQRSSSTPHHKNSSSVNGAASSSGGTSASGAKKRSVATVSSSLTGAANNEDNKVDHKSGM